MSIRARVTWYGIGVVSLVLLVVSGLFGGLLAGSVPLGQDEELRDRATVALASLRTATEISAQPSLTPVDAGTSKDIVVMVLDEGGAVLTTTGFVDGAPLGVPAELLARADRDGSVTATVAELRIHVRPWQHPGLGRRGYVVTAQAGQRRISDQVGVLTIIVISDLVALVAAAMAIWLAAGRALRPLRQFGATADEVGRSADLSRRLPAVRHRDDLGRLTGSFNAMMDRLQEAYVRLAAALAAQQRFTADASHELRTPLTTIRSNAGFLLAHPDAAPADREAALADIDSESTRMAGLVDDLLTLARADGGQPVDLAALDLAELVRDVAGQAGRAHPDRLFFPSGEPAPVHGDAESLRRLLWILIRNAVAHTGDGGRIWIAVATTPGRVVLHVSDNGTGIPAGLEERVFDRFVRADPGRRSDGSGLGLAIARSTVHLHGGRIRAAANSLGGAVITIELPAGSLSSDS
ncbi:signal transduction histidine kinase [Allocatelliglobosispora scoriae]|uniref:histidine kinase n=1 Tax=Allocatelliglobosispora scoriae TaxID=643052 RepID=A0A841BXS9_9ACTN|nr:HAMP domain-containing sensor histidine kinase [Allocatelliglobosispora scoriae]MBB5873957.1 signal transduction histidine kinase [Allocatelliglobosispora scoriae]